MRTQPDHIVGQLHSALKSGQFPSRQKAHGTEILSHLSEAVRVVVLGRPGSGKTSLINMILGGEIIQPVSGVNVIEVMYGKVPHVTLELLDGTTQTISSQDLESLPSGTARRATYEVPLESLKTRAFIEVNQPNDPSIQLALLDTALQEGQVFIWCSEAFDHAEQDIWQTVPETIKDHSFLALTKADRQIMKGDLSQRIAALETAVANEFLGLHPVATLHALKSRLGGAIQNELWDASGGHELVEAVQAQVRKGRAADLDQARLLLAQFGNTTESVSAKDASAMAPENVPAEEVVTAQADLLQQLQTHLQTAAQEMLVDIDNGKLPNADGLLTRCASTVRAMTTMLAAETDQNEDTTDLLEDARDGEETLMLLQVEQSPSATDDAIILMLQLRKEIGARAQA